jgi:hypothetical protein
MRLDKAMLGRIERDARLKWLGFALALVLAGTLLHDLVEFGRPSPENSLPAGLLFGMIFVSWWRWPGARRTAIAVLLTFAVVMLVGGAVASVLPLPVWPFEPEQTLSHYAVHAAWALSLVALIWIVLKRVGAEPYQNGRKER